MKCRACDQELPEYPDYEDHERYPDEDRGWVLEIVEVTICPNCDHANKKIVGERPA